MTLRSKNSAQKYHKWGFERQSLSTNTTSPELVTLFQWIVDACDENRHYNCFLFLFYLLFSKNLFNFVDDNLSVAMSKFSPFLLFVTRSMARIRRKGKTLVGFKLEKESSGPNCRLWPRLKQRRRWRWTSKNIKKL